MNEILCVPEDNLNEVIIVIREGLKHVNVSNETREQLTKWCDEECEYINGTNNDFDKTLETEVAEFKNKRRTANLEEKKLSKYDR